MPRLFWILSLACVSAGLLHADELAPAPRELKPSGPSLTERFRDRVRPARPSDAMPLTGLSPAKLIPNPTVYHYSVSTTSADCQAHCDRAFGYYYSYVWMEAARSFETALKADPNCARAWLGLSQSIDKWGKNAAPKLDPFLALGGAAFQPKAPDRFTKNPSEFALSMAQKLMTKANDRERLQIRAKLQEKGLWPDTPSEERKKRATATLDELLAQYEDDEEAWFARAQIAEGQHGGAPFYKALLRLNPLHPGANHELVHFYENIRRPALGWPYAEGYMKSSPGIPHAFHMQAHLGTRIGKWKNTTEWSWHAIELQRAYHKVMNVKPEDDHQFFHHMEILTKSLLHDGRLADAAKIKAEAQTHKYTMRPEWFRLALLQEDWAEAQKLTDQARKSDKMQGAYMGAMLALARGDISRAEAEVEVLRTPTTSKRGGNSNNYKLWEVQGRLLCRTGQGEAGVKLFHRIIEKTKDDFSHHSWGNGAYYMEAWGESALEAGLVTEAEEAFLEALAHDSGSLRATLGLWALCQRLNRTDEADRYQKLATRLSQKTDAKLVEHLRQDYVRASQNIPTTAVSATATSEDDAP
ncbi:MAG: tetratricopeptide repeat protein [Fimbriiglobus sp.]